MKPHLMHLVLSLGTGGTERLVIELSKSLQDRMTVSVCCLDEVGEWAGELQAVGIEVFSLHRQPGFRPSLARTIAAEARRRRIDVLHCHQYSPFVYGALASLLLPKVRLVYTEHGRQSDAPPSTKRRIANLFLSKIPGAFVAVSAELREHMIAEGFSPGRVEVIRNGIDPGPEVSEADRRRARRMLGLDSNEVVVGTVARLDPVKDLTTLARAFCEIADREGTFRLVVVGDGPETKKLKKILQGSGCRDRVVFTGQRDDARRLMQAFDVYVNTSITEGVSVTILEAMTTGLPVIATRVGGNPEVVDDGRTGILVPARHTEAIASSVVELALDPERGEQLGRAGRRRVEDLFSLARMVESYLRRYEVVLPSLESG